MLPSMPLLMTPVKELHDDSSDTSDDSPFPHHSTEDVQVAESTVQIEESDNLLTLDSCTPESNNDVATKPENDKVIDKQQTPEKRSLSEPTSAQKKKKKNHHKKTLAALTPDSGTSLESSAQSFAEAYFLKVRNQLDNEKWTQFVQELVDFEEKIDKQPTELYNRMAILLSPHTELIDEFLAFLLPHQALQVNQFMTYLVLIKMKEFFRKLNILLMKRQTRQVYSALESLANRPNITLAEVKSTVLPLLKSSPLLTNHFLKLLPGEKPPDSLLCSSLMSNWGSPLAHFTKSPRKTSLSFIFASLMTDFEQVDLKDDSQFETIVVPDCPDPYGNENCICTCHITQKNRHCTICGIKYLNGRVYLQCGKVLRPAKVTFKGNKHLDLLKWEEDKCRSRRRFLPKTLLSPNLDHRLNADSEDDCGVKKSPRTPRIRASRPKVCKKGTSGNKEEVLEGIFPLVESKNVVIEENIMGELVVDCEIKHDVNEEFDDVVMENECNTEEDDEEDLNKGLHSENDSSLEAEDIGKELESGNNCSFEDEEVEYKENNDVVQSKMANINLRNINQERNAEETLTQNCFNNVPDDCINNDNSKASISNTDNNTYKNENVNSFEDSSLSVKQDPDSSSGIKHEEMSIDIIDSVRDIEMIEVESSTNHINSPEYVNVAMSPTCNIKKEEEENFDVDEVKNVDIIYEQSIHQREDQAIVNYEQSSSSLKQESTSEYSHEDLNISDVGSGKSNNETDSSCREWTREEDKIILQTFQHENGLEQTFEIASLQLHNRSKEEVQQRFEVLLKLLKEMISDQSNANP